MRDLTEEQMQKLLDIKEKGTYAVSQGIYDATKRKTKTRRETLFEVLKTYMIFREVTHRLFRARHFATSQTIGRYSKRKYSDCPISQGEFVNAMRYARQNGYVETLNDGCGKKIYRLTLQSE